MKQNKILSLVGLATKAGKTASGEFSTEKSVRGRKSMPGDRFCRELGEHEEKIYEYVYFLQGTYVSVRNKG